MPPLENPFLAALAEVERLRQHDQNHLRGFPCRGDLGKNRAGADARRPGERGRRHAHARADGGRADFPRRHGLPDRRRLHRPARKRAGPRNRADHPPLPDQHAAEVRGGERDACSLQGAVVEIDEQTGRAKGIQRVSAVRCSRAPMAKPVKSQWDFGELFPPDRSRKVLSVTELTVADQAAAGAAGGRDLGDGRSHESARCRAPAISTSRSRTPARR